MLERIGQPTNSSVMPYDSITRRCPAAVARPWLPMAGTMKGSGCRVEKILFQSRPSFYLTANLYLPENQISGERYPAVIVHPGPYDNGKQTLKEGLHDRCAELASRGCAAITYDPIGQGERQQYHDPVTNGIWWRPRPPAWRIYESEKFDHELQDVPGTAVLERSMLAGQAMMRGRLLQRVDSSIMLVSFGRMPLEPHRRHAST